MKKIIWGLVISIGLILVVSGLANQEYNVQINKENCKSLSPFFTYNYDKEFIFERIRYYFGLRVEDYTLECIETGFITRGDYIKAIGRYKDGSNFELFGQWQSSSSGGSSGSYTLCFSSENEELLKNIDEYASINSGRTISGISHTDCLAN